MFKKGVIFVSLFLLILGYTFIAPFNIKADSSTNTAPFIGVNVQVTGVDQDLNSITLPNINFSYGGGTVPSGYVSGRLNCSNPSTPTSTAPCDIFELQNSSGQGGSMGGLKLVFPLHTYYLNPNGNAQVNSGYNYIFDYEFILDDNYKGYVVLDNSITIYVNGNSFHHIVRQQGINQQEFTITDYSLTRVTDPVMWNFPYESFSALIYPLRNYDIYLLHDINTYELPLFKLSSNDILTRLHMRTSSTKYVILFLDTNVIDVNSLANYIKFKGYVSDNVVVNNVRQINVIHDGNRFNCVVMAQIYSPTNQRVDIQVLSNGIYSCFYENYVDYKNVSTDFALRFGLTNRLLDDIDHLANGTTPTNNSSSQADSTNQQAQNTFEQEEQLITNAENNLSNNLQSLDIANKNNQLFGNSKFIASAQWVKTQFDNLTYNNAFGYLITFSLVIGISLVIIGKLRG